MTWRELVFEICHKIPDEQFDEEAKACFSDFVYPVGRLRQNEQDWFYNDQADLIVSKNLSSSKTPIIKQGEWTIE